MVSNSNSLLDLPFKGTRDYLHSTDVLPALIELCHDRFGLQAHVESLTIRRPLGHAILVSFEPSDLSAGSFRVRHGSEITTGWLLETDRPVNGRNPIDVPSVSSSAVSGPGFARLLQPLPNCVIFDLIVGLMKLVLNQVTPGHWWLCQIHLDTPLTEAFPIEVRVRRHIGGQFLVFDIIQADRPIGSARAILDHSRS
jgi:hypothetical protein